ncbi:MAG: basic amino acid/polyamine antiporter, family [Pyrinomonadaceae bacterium]|nr:basic amino acid/polyamine antiporter, family [Pyrinomonadaceae bacterium]
MSYTSLFRKKSVVQIKRDAELGFSDAHGGVGADGEPHLRKTLGVLDLTSLGIAAIVGAGIFAMIGNAAFNGGPAVIFLFMFTAMACGFSALCYAEFASKIPVAGSAYTYAYASFGELIAWIIGWDLLMEYAIGNIAVAISWSDYFTGLLSGYGINVPAYLTMDYLSASRGYAAINGLVTQGNTLEAVRAMPDVTNAMKEAYAAWTTAPRVGGIPVICDLPALGIVFVITALVYVGIRESKRVGNVMVALKLAVIFLVIVLGSFYVNPKNWSPFAPNGASGVLKGVAAVFFAFIGFDALSTTAEECKNPTRDLPRAMIYSLVICTVLYIVLALVLTGMVSYKQLQVGDPLAFVFGPEGANLPWMSGIIAVSAVIAIATVLLVFQLGQPRIWMAMSRDGLLPPIFSSIHPRFKTPWFSTIITGLVVAIPSLFMNLTEVTDLSSIGTLFAFVLVCGGVLLGAHTRGLERVENERTFVPYINSQYIVPAIFIIAWAALLYFNADGVRAFFSFTDPSDPTLGVWEVFRHKIPLYAYIVLAFLMAYFCFRRRLSLIPVLGLMSCAYLMTELGITNWTRFGLWLIVGLVLYFLYGFGHSKLSHPAATTNATQ